jgi:hypothetical protein
MKEEKAMAFKNGLRLPVSMADAFPHGCCLVPDSVTEAMDYDEATRSRTPSRDKVTGQSVYSCRVSDLDPELAGRSREVVVKILADKMRQWSGKTLADHRGDRKAWLLSMLGLPDPADTGRYRWELVTPADGDVMTHGRRMLHVLADRAQWHAALAEARRRAADVGCDPPATGRAA